MQNFNHNFVFREKRNFFRRKLSKIAENCDHNIDPRLHFLVPASLLNVAPERPNKINKLFKSHHPHTCDYLKLTSP
jgi:hypothetical protein